MYQADRGNYRTKESMGKVFMHSCLGRLLIFVAFIFVMLFIAHFTTPTEKEMAEEMEDNIMQCLEENDSIKGDPIDDYVHNLGFIFTKGDKLGPVARENQIESNLKLLEPVFGGTPPEHFASSAEKGLGKEEILNYIDNLLKT